MRVNINPLIIFCGTRTDPAAETKSIGLRVDTAFGEGRRTGALFFARHLDCFIMTRNCSSTYQDLVPFNNFIVTRGFSSIYRDWQKTRHRDADGT
jgi:hypothetical protein